MKKQRLTNLENQITKVLQPLIETPYRVVCSYYALTLRITLINLLTGKSYLIATVRGSKTDDGDSFIEYFYVMPHFHNCGIGHMLLQSYADLQLLEGSKELFLEPLPFVPGSKDPVEYLRLVNWLGGKDYPKMSRRALIRFYESNGFESLDPNNLSARMHKKISA